MIEQEIHVKFPIVLYTDGACRNNGSKNAVGGWAYVLLWDSGKKEVRRSNFERHTTNNRMEIQAIISGFKDIKSRWNPPYPKIAVISDSKYCVQGASSWMYRWREKGWRKKNVDLWKEMFDICQTFNPSFFWVKGHNGSEYNEICDSLAESSASLRQEYSKNIRNSI
jgi:ribonuclease HI